MDCVIGLFSNIFSKDFDENFNKANNYYNNSKYLESIKIYESILAEGLGI